MAALITELAISKSTLLTPSERTPFFEQKDVSYKELHHTFLIKYIILISDKIL